MKSMNLKKIATAGVGAALLGASLAAAATVDEAGLANFKFFNNAEPNVKIAVGGLAQPSDAVVAANIAAMIGNLAYTSSDITVLGKDALSCAGGGGGNVTGASVDLEVTTPGVNPNVAYQMKTYIGGYLDVSPIDDRVDSASGSSYSIIDAAGTSVGRKVTNYEAPALVSKATIADTQAGRTYVEDERYFVYAKSLYDQSTHSVKAKAAQVGYEVQFTNPIAVCTETVPDDTTCTDTYSTIKHRVKIKFLGSDWIIYGMDNFVSTGASMTSGTGGSTVVLGKEVQYKEFMQIGDEATAPNGMKVVLKDISGMPYGSSYVPAASFDIYDASGNKIDTATLQETGSTSEYNKNNIVVKVWKAFVGTGGSAYAQVSIFSNKLSLTHGTTIDTNNQQWSVRLVAGGTSYGASVSRIQLYRMNIDDMNEGDFVTFVQKPQVMKLAFTGLESVTTDTLSLATGSGKGFPMLASGDTATANLNYVRVSSGLTNPFVLGSTSTNTVYYIVSATGAGGGQQGDIFYQDSTGAYSKYYGASSNGSIVFLPGHGALSGTFTAGTASLMYPGNGTCYGTNGTITSLPTNLGVISWYMNASITAGNLTGVSFTGASNATSTDAYLVVGNASCVANVSLVGVSGTINWAGSLTTSLASPAHARFNYVPYTYGSNTKNIEFFTAGITAAADPAAANGYVIAIPEFTDDSDTASLSAAILFDVGQGDSTASPYIGVSSGTQTLGYNTTWTNRNTTNVYGTAYESGLVTNRGSKATVSLTSGSVTYATALAHALYTLSGAEVAGAGNVATPTLKEGETGLDEGGYKVVVKAINGGCAGGEGGAVGGADGLSCSSDKAYVVEALDTSSTPLVVTDAAASGTQALILVGGPLVNSLTAQVPGFATMSPGDSVVKVVGDKVVVAGYTAADTTAAANGLIAWLVSNKDALVR
jgi:hypothetical protein